MNESFLKRAKSFPGLTYKANAWRATNSTIEVKETKIARLGGSPDKDWQLECFVLLRHAHKFILKAVPGAGKSRPAIFIAVDRVTHEKKRSVILVPQQQLAESFLKPCKDLVSIDDQLYSVTMDCNCCANTDGKRHKLRTFLITSVEDLRSHVNPKRVQGLIAMATYANFVQVWDLITEEQRREMVRNTFFIDDECHHLSHDAEDKRLMTRIGGIMDTILSYDDPTCDIGLLTATYVRNDAKNIVSGDFIKDFTKFTLHWDEYYPLLGIQDFHFNFVFYEDKPGGPLDTIADAVRKDSQGHHLIILPRTGDRFRDADTLNLYLRRMSEIVPENRIIEVVTERGKKNLESERGILFNHPRDFTVVIACDKFNEGTDWPPCNYVHNTACGESLPRQYQINGRAFRADEGKTFINITNYLQKRTSTNHLRELVSDLFNAIMTSLMIDEMFCPIICLLPALPGKVAKTVRLSELLDDQYDEFKGEVLLQYTMSMRQCTDLKEARCAVEAVAEKYWTVDMGVSLEKFVEMANQLIPKMCHLRTRGSTVKIDKVEISILRENDFDKIQHKDSLLGDLLFGTEEPMPPEAFKELKRVIEANRGKLQVGRWENIEENIAINRMLQTEEPERMEVARDLTNKWVKVKQLGKDVIGRVLRREENKFIVRVYDQVREGGHYAVMLQNKKESLIFKSGSDMWMPKYLYNLQHTLPGKHRKSLISDQDLVAAQKARDISIDVNDIYSLIN